MFAAALFLNCSATARAQSGPAATRPVGAAALVPPPARPLAVSPDLLAVGPASPGVDTLWAVRVVASPQSTTSAGGVRSRVFVRRSDGRFAVFGAGQAGNQAILGRAVSVAPVGMELAVLLDDGDWLLQSDSASALGRPLPVRDGRLVSFAADADGLYALARLPGGAAALREQTPPAAGVAAGSSGTQSSVPTMGPAGATPTTASAGPAPATGPASRPASNASPAPATATVLLAYAAGQWQPVADLPPEVASSIDPVSLALQDRTPFVLVRESQESIRLWRLDGRVWSAVGQANVSPTTRWVQLVHGGPRPTALVTPASSADADRVLVFDPGRAAAVGPATAPSTAPAAGSATRAAVMPLAAAGTPAAVVNPSADVRPPAIDLRLDPTVGVAQDSRAAAYAAAGPFRLLTLSGERLKEQAYDRATLALLGGSIESNVQDPGWPVVPTVVTAVLAAAMLFAVVASIRRRNQPRATGIDPTDLPLAPTGLRLLAGMIDAVPLIAGQIYALLRYGSADRPAMPNLGADFDPWVLGAIGVYLLYTTLVETLAGRSLGKRLCGLRIVTLDGTAPTRGQLLTRNLLRVIDVGLTFLPLFLILFSPLRQRAGDAAAGTVVIAPELRDAEDREPTEE